MPAEPLPTFSRRAGRLLAVAAVLLIWPAVCAAQTTGDETEDCPLCDVVTSAVDWLDMLAGGLDPASIVVWQVQIQITDGDGNAILVQTFPEGDVDVTDEIQQVLTSFRDWLAALCEPDPTPEAPVETVNPGASVEPYASTATHAD